MRVSNKQAAENRGALLQAANRLFRKRGIDGIGVAEIAKEFQAEFSARSRDLARRAESAPAEVRALDERIARLRARLKAGDMQAGKVQVLDVRREPEWDAGHIEGATWWPLDNFRVSAPEIDHDAPIAVHCKGGYRSLIASSLLQRAGFRDVVNVVGGFDAWQEAKLPLASARPVESTT